MGQVSLNWEKLAEVRGRAQMAKSKARIRKEVIENRPGFDDDPMAGFANSVNYSDGSRAFRFDDEMKGFAYYKSGCIAVVVTKISDYQSKFFFYHDSAEGGDLIGFVNEFAEGFAIQPVGELRQRLVWDSDGGSLVDMDIANKSHETREKWRWDPKSLNSGKIPEAPITIRMNECLELTFKSLEEITAKFQNDGLMQTFDCGLKVRRSDSYLDHPELKRSSVGKIHPVLDPKRFPSLKQRQANAMDQLQLLRASLNPRSDTVDHEKISGIIRDLEVHFKTYDERIKTSSYTPVALNQIQCRKDALAQTLLEVPTVAATGTETGSSGKGDVQLVGRAQSGKRWTHPDGKAMNNLEIHEQLLKENPVLLRPSILRNASGRYSRDATTGVKEAPVKKLQRLSAINFEKYISDGVSQEQLLLVACLRADSSVCRRAEQLLELLHGQIAEKYGESECPYVMVKFEMSESNFLVRKYNIFSLPMYLMFYGGKLVYAGTCGGKPVALTTGRELPRVLLCEPSIKDQLHAEKLLRKAGFQWDLAVSTKEVRHHMRVMQPTADSASKGYGLILIGDSMSNEDIRLITSLFNSTKRSTAGPGGQPLPSPVIATCLKSGTLPFAKGTLLNDHGGLLPKRFRAKMGNSPVACLKSRLVVKASDGSLRGSHFAVQKPLTGASLKALLGRWRNQEFSTDPPGGLAKQSSSSSSNADRGVGPLKPTHMGVSKEGMLLRMKEARELGKKGKFLDRGKLATFGLSLSSMESAVRGVKLTSQ
eukprot:g4384.t1